MLLANLFTYVMSDTCWKLGFQCQWIWVIDECTKDVLWITNIFSVVMSLLLFSSLKRLLHQPLHLLPRRPAVLLPALQPPRVLLLPQLHKPPLRAPPKTTNLQRRNRPAAHRPPLRPPGTHKKTQSSQRNNNWMWCMITECCVKLFVLLLLKFLIFVKHLICFFICLFICLRSRLVYGCWRTLSL